MSKSKFDFKGLEELQKKINDISNKQDIILSAFAKEIAARLLREVIPRTPVGVYDGNDYNCNVRIGNKSRKHKGNKVDGKQGGTLQKGWAIKNIRHEGNTYLIDIINPIEYSSYVENGHRTKNGGWVEGHFMLKISEQELERTSPKILEKKIKKMLEEMFK